MSIIVNNPAKGKYVFTLYVKGEFRAMQPCLRLSKRDIISYNQIGRMYQSRGLKPIVYGMRNLTHKEVVHYFEKAKHLLANFHSPMRNSRDATPKTKSKIKNEQE